MYQLLPHYGNSRYAKNDHNMHTNVKRFTDNNLNVLRRYYRSREFSVKNEHLLAQLLMHVNASFNRDIQSFVDVIGQDTDRLASVFRLVSPSVEQPKVYAGEFYNPAVKEIIILHAEPFNVNKAWREWDQITPVKVHAHGFDDFSMALCTGDYPHTPTDTDYAVISINLPMLALQYRAWWQKFNRDLEHPRTLQNFCHDYPILNMLTRHLEIALLNRTWRTWLGTAVTPFENPHNVVINDISNVMDKLMVARAHVLDSNNYSFEQLYHTFHGLRFSTWSNFVRTIDLPPVITVRWALELQFIPHVKYYLEYLDRKKINLNRSELTIIERTLQRARYNGILSKVERINLGRHFDDIRSSIKNL